MIYILDGLNITNQQFKHDGITYPSNWLELSTDDEKLALGISKLTEVYPILNDSTKKYDDTFVDDYEKKTRTYNVINKSVEEVNFDNMMFNSQILNEINELELKQPEIVRDFLLNVNGARERLEELKNSINILKAKLK